MGFTNLKWEQPTPDYWELKATLTDQPSNPDGTPQRVVLVIAKKQGEGQWRVSYSKDRIGWPGENATSLNDAARNALMKLHASNIKAPWINGSLFSPMLGSGVSSAPVPPPPPPYNAADVKVPTPASVSAEASARPSARAVPSHTTAELQRQVQQLLQSEDKEQPRRRTVTEQQPRRDQEGLSAAQEAEIDRLLADAENSRTREPDSLNNDPTPPQEEKSKVKLGYYESQFEYPKEKKMSSIERMVEAATHGAKVSVADEAANSVLEISQALFGDAYPEMMKTPAGRAMVKATTSLALHYAAEKYPAMVGGEQMAKGLQAATELVVEASARDLIQPQIAKITPVVRQLAEIGTQSLSAQLPKT